jgi:hypothetical protein
MPSGEHESAVAAFAAFPDATAALLDRTFRIGLPRHDDAHRGPATFQKLAPTSYHADNTLVFTRAGKRVYALVIEVQRRWVPGKWRAWKYYATSLEPAFAALNDGMHHADQAVSRKICDMLLVALSKAARDLWEEHMTVVDYEYRSELFRELKARGKTEGKAEGKADSVLRVLSRRGVPVPAAVEEQIRACADLDLLDTWLDRALTAVSAEDVIAQPSRGARRVDL